MSLSISTKYVANHAITGKEVVLLKATWGNIELLEGEYYKVYSGNGSNFTAEPILETLQLSQRPEAQRILQKPDVRKVISMAIKNAFQDKV